MADSRHVEDRPQPEEPATPAPRYVVTPDRFLGFIVETPDGFALRGFRQRAQAEAFIEGLKYRDEDRDRLLALVKGWVAFGLQTWCIDWDDPDEAATAPDEFWRSLEALGWTFEDARALDNPHLGADSASPSEAS